MTALVRLRLSGNRLAGLPREVARLKRLEELSLSNNALQAREERARKRIRPEMSEEEREREQGRKRGTEEEEEEESE